MTNLELLSILHKFEPNVELMFLNGDSFNDRDETELYGIYSVTNDSGDVVVLILAKSSITLESQIIDLFEFENFEEFQSHVKTVAGHELNKDELIYIFDDLKDY